jgi:hypothetical protein
VNTPDRAFTVINAKTVMKEQSITVIVRGVRMLRWRLALGTIVIKFGGWIIGVGHTTVKAEARPS